MDEALDIPASWLKLDLSRLSGVVMVLGASDSGKSTFARYLYRRLVDSGRRTVFLDGDPGQTFLGPPASVTVAFGFSPHQEAASQLPLQPGLEISGEEISSRPVLRSFIGSTTPARNLLTMLVGVDRLVNAACDGGADVLVYDTDGMIDPGSAGAFLKLNLVDLLRPQMVFAIQKDRDLEPILAPLRKSRRTSLIELEPSPAIHSRSRQTRRSHRQEMFAHYFLGAQELIVHWPRLAVFPAPRFLNRQLIGFEDSRGFMPGMGIILDVDSPRRTVRLLSSLPSIEGVDALRLGDLLVDIESFSDELR